MDGPCLEPSIPWSDKHQNVVREGRWVGKGTCERRSGRIQRFNSPSQTGQAAAQRLRRFFKRDCDGLAVRPTGLEVEAVAGA